jgi:hypothetical protein
MIMEVRLAGHDTRVSCVHGLAGRTATGWTGTRGAELRYVR